MRLDEKKTIEDLVIDRYSLISQEKTTQNSLTSIEVSETIIPFDMRRNVSDLSTCPVINDQQQSPRQLAIYCTCKQ